MIVVREKEEITSRYGLIIHKILKKNNYENMNEFFVQWLREFYHE